MSEIEEKIDQLVDLYTNTKMKEKVNVDITDIGDIMGIARLNWDCVRCGGRADFSVTLSNEQLPKPYIKDGQRNVTYCSNCLPKRAKQRWDFYNNFENW
jgi:hypothetical protein